MADEPPKVKVPQALVDFGRAVGRDVPRRLQRAQNTALAIRAAATTNKPKRKG